MNITRDDILEALGLQSSRLAGWVGPALIGFGAGALVGVTVTLLVAPRRGEELRSELMERGRRAVRRGREQAEEFLGEGGRETH